MVSSRESILKVEDLTFSYPNSRTILKQISFNIEAHQRTILLGPNGAGKSTLMFNILGLYSPQQGEIYLKGRSLSNIKQANLRQEIAYVFQNPDDQVFAPTVEEDILFGPQQFNIDLKEQKERLKEIIDLLQIKHLLSRNPRYLSYGEKRRVALAGVLIMNPEIIFLDEPLAFLDPLGRKLFIQIMNQLIEEGKTLLVATHDLNFASEWGEKFLVLDNGEISTAGGQEIFREGITVFDNSLPLLPQVFKGVVPDNKLPLTVEEGRDLLKDLLG